MKRAFIAIVAALILSTSVCAFAAQPDSIASGAGGTVSNLIVVRKPETVNSATTRNLYGITGVGNYGVNVAFYRFDGSQYLPITLSDGARVQTTIGAAGIFYKQVELREGHNYFAVRAEASDGSCQIVYFDINLLKQEIINNIKNLTNDMQLIFNGWLN